MVVSARECLLRRDVRRGESRAGGRAAAVVGRPAVRHRGGPVVGLCRPDHPPNRVAPENPRRRGSHPRGGAVGDRALERPAVRRAGVGLQRRGRDRLRARPDLRAAVRRRATGRRTPLGSGRDRHAGRARRRRACDRHLAVDGGPNGRRRGGDRPRGRGESRARDRVDPPG